MTGPKKQNNAVIKVSDAAPSTLVEAFIVAEVIFEMLLVGHKMFYKVILKKHWVFYKDSFYKNSLAKKG